MLLSEGQMSDYKGAALMLDALPRAKAMLGDKGYDADWFRNALIKRGIVPCIPSKANRKIPIAHDQTLYRQRHKIENMFGKLKDWRRIHTRYDRCAHTFFSAICIAATIIFWINQGFAKPALPGRRRFAGSLAATAKRSGRRPWG
jgi:transposase